MDHIGWLTLLTTALGSGGLVAALGKYLDHCRASRSDYGTVSMKIIESLQSRVATLEEEHSECLKTNARLLERLGCLQEAVRRLEGLSFSAIMVVDEKGTVEDCSGSACEFFHLSREHLVGLPIEKLLPSWSSPETYLKSLKKTSQKILDASAIDAFGAIRPVNVVLRRQESQDGAVRFLLEIRPRH